MKPTEPEHDIHEQPTINEIVDAYVEPRQPCPHLRQDYPGAPINSCLDCGELLGEPRQPPAAPEMLRLKQAAMMLADGYESYRSEFQALTTPERILSILNCRADSLTEEATKQLMAETRTYFSAFGNPAVAVTPEYRAIANRTMKEWAKKFDALAAELKEQK